MSNKLSDKSRFKELSKEEIEYVSGGSNDSDSSYSDKIGYYKDGQYYLPSDPTIKKNRPKN